MLTLGYFPLILIFFLYIIMHLCVVRRPENVTDDNGT